MITLLIADDHVMVRAGFKMILEQQPDLQVIAEASTPDEAFVLATDTKPDVVLSDISMGNDKSGLLLAQRIAQSPLNTHVVMLTMHAEQEYLMQALKVGACGYVLKSSSDHELIAAIRKAAVGDTYICEALMNGFVHEALFAPDHTKNVLTPREAELVSYTVKGYSNKDISAALSISVKTVESQKAKIMTKLGISTKPELFEYAAKHGLVSLS